MIEHGGNLMKLAELAGCAPEELLDFSTNLRIGGIPDGLFEVCFRALEELSPYPEPHAETLSALAAEKWGVSPCNVLFGNGSSELLALIPQLGFRRAVVVTPGYLEYEACCRRAGLPVERVELDEADDFNLCPETIQVLAGDLVVIGNPANPVGNTTPVRELHEWITRNPQGTFLVDEAFADFSGGTLLDLPLPENLIVLRSMTKYYAIAGLRLGYAIASETTILALRERQTVWSVGTVAARAAEFLLKRPAELDDHVPQLRQALAEELAALGFKVFPSEANYLLIKSNRPLFRELLAKRIAVRDCSNYPGLSELFIRVAVRSGEDNAKLLDALRRKPSRPRRRTPALMLQGTCSNAGKSVLTAGFCRILLQDGFRVAPFKAQNMALNSFVTDSGGEMGRAQAVQAEACRLDPDVRMNPILLRPDSDQGSQVVVLGKVIGNMRVREFYRNKPRLWETVKQSYDSLASECDAMVLEGAGSPGEINLKKNDLVNMNMAAYAGAQVLLAGDIDRGGVYASFIGTYATFSMAERKLLAGFLVNKFRGDATLLDDAHTYVERMTGKPVLGVIDYLRDLGLPEEDSLGFSFVRPAAKLAKTLDMAVIRLGHIANFTDFVPFELEPDVTVRKVEHFADLGTPDIVVLPGSESVAADLMRIDRGALRQLRDSGVHIIGICGGLQMLGNQLLDPDGAESPHRELQGLGFLDLVTTYRHERTVRRTRAYRGDTELSGYELHRGVTVSKDKDLRVHIGDDGEVKGFETDRIFTSYLHGVFDDDRFRRLYLNEVRRRLGMAPLEEVTAEYEVERALDRLAAHLRSRVDMGMIYRKMGV